MAKDKEEATGHKYTVENLVKDLELTPQSVRIKLRNHKVKKAEDGVYGWDSRADYDEVVAELKAPAKKPKSEKAAKKEKPAKAAKKEPKEKALKKAA